MPPTGLNRAGVVRLLCLSGSVVLLVVVLSKTVVMTRILASRTHRYEQEIDKQKEYLRDLIQVTHKTIIDNQDHLEQAAFSSGGPLGEAPLGGAPLGGAPSGEAPLRTRETPSGGAPLGGAPSIDPLQDEIDHLLRVGWQDYGKASRLLVLYNRKLEQDPQNVHLLATIGRIHKQLGDYTQAIRYYKRSLENLKNDDDRRPELVHQLSQIYVSMGLAVKARSLQERFAEELSNSKETIR